MQINTKTKQKIKGHDHITAGRDVIIIDKKDHGMKDFHDIDNKYANNIDKNKKLTRLGKETIFSSKDLFISLVRVGLGYHDALNTTENVVDELAYQKEMKGEGWIPKTVDIRHAVKQVLYFYVDIGTHSKQQVDLWFTSYLKRYGDPQLQYIKVIDNGEHVDFNYEYLKHTILPHVFCRIFGLSKVMNPLEMYNYVFSGTVVTLMSNALMHYVNSLCIYSIRYKTIINLLQDFILEPPHPWIVNNFTKHNITKYNIEHARSHYECIVYKRTNQELNYSINEYIQHSCAAILSMYGAFLGVGYRYGLLELDRILRLEDNAPHLWDFCEISKVNKHLKKLNSDKQELLKILERTRNLLQNRAKGKKLNDQMYYGNVLFNIAYNLYFLDTN